MRNGVRLLRTACNRRARATAITLLICAPMFALAMSHNQPDRQSEIDLEVKIL
jgi:hypothetical protein